MAINNLIVHFKGKTVLLESYSLKLFVKGNECGVIDGRYELVSE